MHIFVCWRTACIHSLGFDRPNELSVEVHRAGSLLRRPPPREALNLYLHFHFFSRYARLLLAGRLRGSFGLYSSSPATREHRYFVTLTFQDKFPITSHQLEDYTSVAIEGVIVGTRAKLSRLLKQFCSRLVLQQMVLNSVQLVSPAKIAEALQNLPAHCLFLMLRQQAKVACSSASLMPFAVGIELHREDLGDLTAVAEDKSLSGLKRNDSSSPLFVPTIMHRNVSTHGFISRVLYDASSTEISHAFSVPRAVVETVWLTGILNQQSVRNQKPPALRWQPKRDEIVGNGVADRLHSAKFSELHISKPKVDSASRDFAEALIARLQALVAKGSPSRRRLGRSTLTSSKQRQSAKNNCGFSATGHHPHIHLLCDDYAVFKREDGLYKCARASAAISAISLESEVSERHSYFEVHVVQDEGAGGISIGVSSDKLPLNKLVGSDYHSCGYHSSGQVVRRGGEFSAFGVPFKSGDRIGCLVTVRGRAARVFVANPHVSEIGSHTGSYEGRAAMEASLPTRSESVDITFFVNSERQGTVCEPLWQNVVETERYLYPTVSLYKMGSKAVIRCCRRDWQMGRDEIVGPEEKVYSICGE